MKYSKEIRKKMSESHKKRGTKPPSRKGVKLSNEHKRKLSKAHKGKKLSEETKKRMSIAKKGKPNGREGVRLSKKTKIKISKSVSKENHPNWQGGKSFEEYSFGWTDDLRDSIRKRDNYICQLCGIHQDELVDSYTKLDVHHIDYDKNNLDPNNLISLCRKCHMKTNFDREYWIRFFEKVWEN